MARRVRVRQLRRRSTCRSTSRPASTRCTGATACSWAARSTASRTRRTRSTSGRASRRRAREAKELFRPRGGITLQAQPTKDLSVAGQWFYNWQADPHPRIGKLPDDPGPAQLRRRLVHLRTESARRGESERAQRTCASGAATTSSRRANSGSLGDWGMSARWSPAVARRHAGLLLPQHDRRLPAGDGDAGRARACRPPPARRAAARRCPAARFASSTRTRPRSPTCRSTASSGLYNGAYGDNIHIYGITLREEHRRGQRRRGAFVSPEHAAA